MVRRAGQEHTSAIMNYYVCAQVVKQLNTALSPTTLLLGLERNGLPSPDLTSLPSLRRALTGPECGLMLAQLHHRHIQGLRLPGALNRSTLQHALEAGRDGPRGGCIGGMSESHTDPMDPIQYEDVAAHEILPGDCTEEGGSSSGCVVELHNWIGALSCGLGESGGDATVFPR